MSRVGRALKALGDVVHEWTCPLCRDRAMLRVLPVSKAKGRRA